MGTIAAIASAAISAAGTAYSASQAGSGGGVVGNVRTTKIPQTPEQRGLQKYYSRLLASNLTSVAPSFNDYVMSGGAARFPLQNTGFNPREAQLLGLIDEQGKPISTISASAATATGLDEAQQRALGKVQFKAGEVNAPLVRANRWENRIGDLQGRLDNVGPNREQHIMDRIQNMQDRIKRLRGL